LTNGKINLESPINQCDIAEIKVLLAQGLNESEIGLRLGVRSETVSRKISAWSKTSDFKDWIGECWLALFGKVAASNPVEAFRQVNRLFCQLIAARPDQAEEIKNIQVSWGFAPERADSCPETTEQTQKIANLSSSVYTLHLLFQRR
jgi:hypothetical protein